MAFRSLDKLVNLADGYRRVFRIDHRELLLIQEGGERWLLDRRCPHAGQQLDGADVGKGRIQCPLHGFCFSLRDGETLLGTCASLRVYGLVYEGNSVGVDDGQL